MIALKSLLDRQSIKSIQWTFWIGLLLVYLGLIPHLLSVISGSSGDVRLYQEVTRDLFNGTLPYRDRVFEYPPYAVIWFLLPAAGLNSGLFPALFTMQILLMDLVFKLWLLIIGTRDTNGIQGLIPVAAYTLGTLFIGHFYVQRFDLIPAMLSAVSMTCFIKGRFGWSGAALGLGIGSKLYPLVFLPMMALLSWRLGRSKPFMLGLGWSLLPILIMGMWLPWWEFMAFHDERGFEAESLYAVWAWWLHYLIPLDVHWTFQTAWLEVQGPSLDWLIKYAKGFCLFSTALAASIVCYKIVSRDKTEVNHDMLEQSALIVLLPFVIFNIVFSPQYMIWLLVPSCMSLIETLEKPADQPPQSWRDTWRSKWPMAVVVLCCILTPIWYPSPQFGSGLDFFQTSVLMIRNMALLLIWLFLIHQTWSRTRKKIWSASA